MAHMTNEEFLELQNFKGFESHQSDTLKQREDKLKHRQELHFTLLKFLDAFKKSRELAEDKILEIFSELSMETSKIFSNYGKCPRRWEILTEACGIAMHHHPGLSDRQKVTEMFGMARTFFKAKTKANKKGDSS